MGQSPCRIRNLPSLQKVAGFHKGGEFSKEGPLSEIALSILLPKGRTNRMSRLVAASSERGCNAMQYWMKALSGALVVNGIIVSSKFVE